MTPCSDSRDQGEFHRVSRSSFRLLLVASLALFATTTVQAQVVLLDNGPFVTNVGTGSGGADESIMQDIALGDQTLGVPHSSSGAFVERVSDQFTVSDPTGWTISQARLYAYELGSGTTSTITAINLRIWDGDPSMVGSLVVFGDTATDRLVSSSWTGAYRVAQGTSGTAVNRPIMESLVAVGVFLPQGTYWLDWQTDASGGGDVLAVPITIPNQAVTGDALRYSTAGIPLWNPVLDSGSNSAKGLPFVLLGVDGGEPNEIPLSPAALGVLAALLALVALRRRF